MDNNQALGLIYQAARMANLSAQDHENIVKAARQLNEVLNPKKEVEEKKDYYERRRTTSSFRNTNG